MNQFNEFQIVSNLKKAILQEDEDLEKLSQIFTFQIVFEFIKSKNMTLSQKYFNQECPFQKQMKEGKDSIINKIKDYLKIEQKFKPKPDMSILENLLIFYHENLQNVDEQRENNQNINNLQINKENFHKDQDNNQILLENKTLQKKNQNLKQENSQIKEQMRRFENELTEKFERKYQELMSEIHQSQLNLQNTKRLLSERKQFQEFVSQQKQINHQKLKELSEEIYQYRNKQILTRSQQLVGNIDPMFQKQLTSLQLDAPIKESDLNVIHKQLDISKTENYQLQEDINILHIQKKNLQEQLENLQRKQILTQDQLDQQHVESLQQFRKFQENKQIKEELEESNKQLKLKLWDLQNQLSEQTQYIVENKENQRKALNYIEEKHQAHILLGETEITSERVMFKIKLSELSQEIEDLKDENQQLRFTVKDMKQQQEILNKGKLKKEKQESLQFY